MQKITWEKLTTAERSDALARPDARSDAGILDVVQGVFAEVAADGDAAIMRYSEKFDRAPAGKLDLTDSVVAAARSVVEDADYAALKFAAENIHAFHKAEPIPSYDTEVVAGVSCARVFRPVRRAGLYVPGGTAPLFSSLLMLAIPAQVACVGDLVVCTPPNRSGQINPLIILAADLCSLKTLHLVGGAQAIAGMALGTQMIPKVNIIAGPGNAYVTAAKSFAATMPAGPAVDMPAGPSELMVIADAAADMNIIAADLLSQAEHDPAAQVVLVTDSEQLASAIGGELDRQLVSLPRRDMAAESLQHGRVILVPDMNTAVDIANDYAPEHLSLNVAGATSLIDEISTAGTVFVGPCAAETFSDYVAGPSHVLPTDGAAHSWSGVSVATFLRSMTVQQVSAQGAQRLAPAAARLARLEGLEAHARAADIRLQQARPS